METDEKLEEQQIGTFEEIDSVKITEDRLICPRQELLFNSILYSNQSEESDVSSRCFYYNLKKSKIDHVCIAFSSVENREKFDSRINQLVNGRRTKNRMFAFVNPSSGMGKGMTNFLQLLNSKSTL